METIGIIGAVISIVAVITFFIMAFRLGSISSYVLQIGNRISNTPFYEAQIAEILGKTQEAIEKYTGVLYLVTFSTYRINKHNEKQSIDFLVARIKKLGGTIPDSIKEKSKFIS